MPNWVRNVVIPKNMKAFKKAVLDEKNEFDFEKIMPCPESMHITSPTYYQAGMFSRPTDFQRNRLDPILNNLYADNISCEDFVEIAKKFIKAIGLKDKVLENYNVKDEVIDSLSWGKPTNRYDEVFIAYFNLRRYGCTNWHDWNCSHWGTKWNASDTFVDDNCIEFQTAWSTPDGIWSKLALKFDFVVMYADEDTGSNCGTIECVDGEVITDALEYGDYSVAFANCVWSGTDYDYAYEKDEGLTVPSSADIKDAESLYEDYLNFWSER